MSTIVTASNASDATLASALTELGGEDKGTLAYLVVRKKGITRGVSGNRITYNDDTVQVLIWSGFCYRDLAERSYKKLHIMWGGGDLAKRLLAEVEAKGYVNVTLQDVSEAIQETEDNFLKVMNGGMNTMDIDDAVTVEALTGDIPPHHWDTLKVNGQVVRGAKVYVGQGDPSDPRAPVPGNIYIDGVKLGEKVIQAAPNGHWKPKSKPKTVAKDILRSWLPVGLYVRYCLDKEMLLEDPKVGADASAAAKAAQIPIDPESLRQLFKLIP